VLIPRLRLLVACLWAGSLWTVGYLVAPTLFATLADRVLAGTIAGSLFRIESWLCLGCGAVFIVLTLAARTAPVSKLALYLALAMLASAAVNLFGLMPAMAEMREAAGSAGVMASEMRSRFGMLHGVSMGVYLVQSVLGIALVLKSR
jgi:hypothetical protein